MTAADSSRPSSPSDVAPSAAEILAFWFEEHGTKDWWGASPAFDAEIADRFSTMHQRVAAGEGVTWRTSAAGRLAEIIVLDQFSRQLFRNDARAFATDGMALVLAQEAVLHGAHNELASDRRGFMLMPFVHSESIAVHEWAAPYFAALGGGYGESAGDHLAVLRQFGRFPKRNAALGRPSTPEEQAYLGNIGDRMF